MNKKVTVLTSNRTVSAAENFLLALKKNDHVKVFGKPTLGLTTLNTNVLLRNLNSKDVWEIVCFVGYLEIKDCTNDTRKMRNLPIEPDIKNNFPSFNQGNTKLIRQLNQWFEG